MSNWDVSNVKDMS
ncbi:MAG: hypothetical protein IKO56_09515, partial [Alphaproteobacteria bacterium]|nr:hypothetical protein [Alphaproteobacteria bacterium]